MLIKTSEKKGTESWGNWLATIIVKKYKQNDKW